MKITKKQLEQILEIIDENTEHEILIQGYQDYGVSQVRDMKKILEKIKDV